MTPPLPEVVLCRYAEVFLKGGNRPAFEEKLAANMRRALRQPPEVPARVERLHGRMLVRLAAGGTASALARLERVFGLVSFSPVRLVERDLAAIVAAALVEASRLVRDGARPTFKVETRRADKRFQPSSPQVSRQVGAAIIAATGLAVDVHRPEATIEVEIGYEHAFVFAGALPGPGGLPVGCAGEADLLLSGGIDSPVAGYLAMKRGCHLQATYFHSFPYTGDRTRDKVVRIARALASWQSGMVLRVVPFTEAQKALRAAGDPRYAVVLYRRMMMRIAERLARRRGALALVTGDALSQVASQTLTNLAVVSAATPLFVLRPLIGHDKQDTVAWAQRIGTYDLSIEPYEDCCSLFVPDHPETHADLAATLEMESRLDVEALADGCADAAEIVKCQPRWA